MLVIGHRGAASLAAENTIESLWAGFHAGADILEFDVRLTADSVPILSHDLRLYGKRIRSTPLSELQQFGKVTTLEEVLDTFFGKILLNLEYKPLSDVDIVYYFIKTRYIKETGDWRNILFSSFHINVLRQLRRLNTSTNLALLHSVNPFAFVTYQRRLRFAAVGWHRLHINKLAIEIAHKSDIFSYVYTVNRPEAAKILEQKGIDGVVTDCPDRIMKKLSR